MLIKLFILQHTLVNDKHDMAYGLKTLGTGWNIIVLMRTGVIGEMVNL